MSRCRSLRSPAAAGLPLVVRVTDANDNPVAGVSVNWTAEGGGLGARHCVAIAMYESGNYVPAATQLEQIEREMGAERPDTRHTDRIG